MAPPQHFISAFSASDSNVTTTTYNHIVGGLSDARKICTNQMEKQQLPMKKKIQPKLHQTNINSHFTSSASSICPSLLFDLHIFLVHSWPLRSFPTQVAGVATEANPLPTYMLSVHECEHITSKETSRKGSWQAEKAAKHLLYTILTNNTPSLTFT